MKATSRPVYQRNARKKNACQKIKTAIAADPNDFDITNDKIITEKGTGKDTGKGDRFVLLKRQGNLAEDKINLSSF